MIHIVRLLPREAVNQLTLALLCPLFVIKRMTVCAAIIDQKHFIYFPLWLLRLFFFPTRISHLNFFSEFFFHVLIYQKFLSHKIQEGKVPFWTYSLYSRVIQSRRNLCCNFSYFEYSSDILACLLFRHHYFILAIRLQNHCQVWVVKCHLEWVVGYTGF